MAEFGPGNGAPHISNGAEYRVIFCGCFPREIESDATLLSDSTNGIIAPGLMEIVDKLLWIRIRIWKVKPENEFEFAKGD